MWRTAVGQNDKTTGTTGVLMGNGSVLGWKRRAVFLVMTFVLSWGVLEVASFLLYAVLRGSVLSHKEFNAARETVIFGTHDPDQWQQTPSQSAIVHPYLGFVYNRDVEFKHGKQLSQFGFWDTESPLRKPSADTVVIGLFGGSMARWFGDEGMQPLLQVLKKSPRFRRKEFTVTSTALGGYKQPQQLLALTYLLA